MKASFIYWKLLNRPSDVLFIKKNNHFQEFSNLEFETFIKIIILFRCSNNDYYTSWKLLETIILCLPMLATPTI